MTEIYGHTITCIGVDKKKFLRIYIPIQRMFQSRYFDIEVEDREIDKYLNLPELSDAVAIQFFDRYFIKFNDDGELKDVHVDDNFSSFVFIKGQLLSIEDIKERYKKEPVYNNLKEHGFNKAVRYQEFFYPFTNKQHFFYAKGIGSPQGVTLKSQNSEGDG